MTIGVAQRARHLPFEGTSDPSLPVSMWICSVESTGDASGGTNSTDVILTESGSGDDGFWSLEQFLDQHDETTARDRLLIFNNQRNLIAPATPLTSSWLMDGATGFSARTGILGRDFRRGPVGGARALALQR